MHAIRERIHIAESFDLMSQLPILLKGMYAHNWKFHERPQLDYDDIEGMKIQVKKFQDQYGEQKFDWSKSTEEIISITLLSLSKYLSEGQFEHIKGQMPPGVKPLFP
ncbi:MAG: DUF2267 domain-containing protein [Anditalea sp.]